MTVDRNYILALETAVGGGSLSIRNRFGVEVGGAIGETGISRAEDVLENIEKLLAEKEIDKWQIGSVILGTEAGSATGLKIGASIGKGLARGLGCCYAEISLWTALKEVASDNVQTWFYMPAGRDLIGRRFVRNGEYVGELEITTLETESFDEDVETDIYASAALLNKISNKVRGHRSASINIKILNSNLSGYLSQYASDNANSFITKFAE